MRTQNESDQEKGINQEEPREHAGFEMAAEPNKTCCCCSPRFHVLAQCIVILIVSLIYSIIGYKDLLICSAIGLFMTILVIALPKFFANFYSFAVQLLFWIAFCLYTLTYLIICVVAKIKLDNESEKRTKGDKGGAEASAFIINVIFIPFIAIFSIILLFSMLATFLIFRMTLFAYKNR
ncbi:hypothetical protein GCK72_000845 [Caenorhabditis remanei]|uniref:Uncharacterized protein n=1 Tax=Caenorhabditis remanei TaxID=31234 RepID=A0A6A5HTB1_CAERE|nr:hypothetical protein GCK72_000845 [Caenorhabditis remanei]KAF1769032.1 hypothetical protein GCK72_000845 [Caenorhabditis remanei]